jgi:hypothetical protein
VKGAKNGAADRKPCDTGADEHGGVEPVSTGIQAVVENLVRPTQTALELASTETG